MIYTMSDIDELMALRPLVSQLRHDLERERRERGKTQQRLDAELALTHQLRAQLVALREAQRSQLTPPLGNQPVQTDAITRKSRDHG